MRRRTKQPSPCACGGCRQCRFGYHCGPCSAAFRGRKARLNAIHFYPGYGIYSGFTSCGTRGRVTADPELVTCQSCIKVETDGGIPWPATHAEYVAARSSGGARLRP